MGKRKSGIIKGILAAVLFVPAMVHGTLHTQASLNVDADCYLTANSEPEFQQDLEDYQSLNYDIPIPEGTELTEGEASVTVTVVVDGVSERRVTTSNFAVENAPEGFVAELVTERLEILLRGLDTELDALSGENLLVTADLSGIQGAGSYTVPATVTINGYSNVGVKGNYQVIVSVAPPVTPDSGVQTASLDDLSEAVVSENGKETQE